MTLYMVSICRLQCLNAKVAKTYISQAGPVTEERMQQASFRGMW